MYVRGYLQGSENGRVVTIDIIASLCGELFGWLLFNVVFKWASDNLHFILEPRWSLFFELL